MTEEQLAALKSLNADVSTPEGRRTVVSKARELGVTIPAGFIFAALIPDAQ